MPSAPNLKRGRVAVIASYAPSLTVFRGPLLRGLAARGHQVVALAPDPDPSTVTQLTAWGVRTRGYFLQRTGTNPMADLRSLLSLRHCLRQERPDLVLGYTLKPVVYGTFAARSARVPRVCSLVTGVGHLLTGDLSRFSPVRSVLLMLLGRALRGQHCVFFQNRDDCELLRRLKVLPADAVVRIVDGSGVDLDHYRPAPAVTEPVSFLLIARLIREKGVIEYCQAAAAVRRDYPACSFRIAGFFDDHPSALRPADLEPWLQTGDVEYLGPLEDVRPALAAASVYVLPSYREGMPRTVLEAMATGRPIITTDVPGCRETVRPGENGWLVAERDSQALAAAARRFARDPSRIPIMGAKSLELVRARFDVRRVNVDMMEGMGV